MAPCDTWGFLPRTPLLAPDSRKHDKGDRVNCQVFQPGREKSAPVPVFKNSAEKTPRSVPPSPGLCLEIRGAVPLRPDPCREDKEPVPLGRSSCRENPPSVQVTFLIMVQGRAFLGAYREIRYGGGLFSASRREGSVGLVQRVGFLGFERGSPPGLVQRRDSLGNERGRHSSGSAGPAKSYGPSRYSSSKAPV